jgi:hypothetical protein
MLSSGETSVQTQGKDREKKEKEEKRWKKEQKHGGG